MTRGIPGAIPTEQDQAKQTLAAAPGQTIKCYYCVMEGFDDSPASIIHISGTTYCLPHARKLIAAQNGT